MGLNLCCQAGSAGTRDQACVLVSALVIGALIAGRSALQGRLVRAWLNAAARLAAAAAALPGVADAELRGVIAVFCGGFGYGKRAFGAVSGGGQRWWALVLGRWLCCGRLWTERLWRAVQHVYLRARANGCGLQT